MYKFKTTKYLHISISQAHYVVVKLLTKIAKLGDKHRRSGDMTISLIVLNMTPSQLYYKLG